MVRGLLWLIVLFALAIGLSFATSAHESTVHILMGDTQYIMNFNTLVMGVLTVWFLLFLLARFAGWIAKAPEAVKRFDEERGSKRGERDLNDLGLAYFEGRYQTAQQIAERICANAHAKDKRALALIFAANAAELARDPVGRDKYLMKLRDFPEKTQLPRYLLLAEDAINRRDLDQAERYLREADGIMPNLTQTMKLDLRRALLTEDLGQIMRGVRRLSKNGALSESEVETVRALGYSRAIARSSSLKELLGVAKKLSEEELRSPLSVGVAKKFCDLGYYGKAIDWVKKRYPQNRQDDLLGVAQSAFPYLSNGQQSKLLDSMEEWLKFDPKNDALLLCLGQLAYQKTLWGKAQSFLEAAVNNKPTIGGHLSLANVYDEIGKYDLAQRERALALSIITQEEGEAAEADDGSGLPAARGDEN